MKKYLLLIFIIIGFNYIFSKTIDHNNYDNIEITTGLNKKIQSFKIYFGYQSVGSNIVQGLEFLSKQNYN